MNKNYAFTAGERSYFIEDKKMIKIYYQLMEILIGTIAESLYI